MRSWHAYGSLRISWDTEHFPSSMFHQITTKKNTSSMSALLPPWNKCWSKTAATFGQRTVQGASLAKRARGSEVPVKAGDSNTQLLLSIILLSSSGTMAHQARLQNPSLVPLPTKRRVPGNMTVPSLFLRQSANKSANTHDSWCLQKTHNWLFVSQACLLLSFVGNSSDAFGRQVKESSMFHIRSSLHTGILERKTCQNMIRMLKRRLVMPYSRTAVKVNFVQGPKAWTQTCQSTQDCQCRKGGQNLLSSDSQLTVCESSMLVAQLHLRKLIRRIWASGQGV